MDILEYFEVYMWTQKVSDYLFSEFTDILFDYMYTIGIPVVQDDSLYLVKVKGDYPDIRDTTLTDFVEVDSLEVPCILPPPLYKDLVWVESLYHKFSVNSNWISMRSEALLDTVYQDDGCVTTSNRRLEYVVRYIVGVGKSVEFVVPLGLDYIPLPSIALH